MPTHHSPYPSPTDAPPNMADVWRSYGSDPALVAANVTRHIAFHAPLVPVHIAMPEHSEPFARPRPLRDSLGWSCAKHLVQLALVGSVVLLVLDGGDAPRMALSYVVTALLLMAVVTASDRQRVQDRDPAMEFVEFITPERPPAHAPAPTLRPAPLTPLVEQMQSVMPERVRVT